LEKEIDRLRRLRELEKGIEKSTETLEFVEFEKPHKRAAEVVRI